MPRDPVKLRAKATRYRERKKIEKYGIEAAGKDMRGRHGNHARGSSNGKWAGDSLLTSQGYVAVRVPPEHPHAWGPPGLHHFRYAYEHVVVATRVLGRALHADETVHHRNGDRADNREENLEVLTRSHHARHHTTDRGRDDLGRFPSAPSDLRVREEMPR